MREMADGEANRVQLAVELAEMNSLRETVQGFEIRTATDYRPTYKRIGTYYPISGFIDSRTPREQKSFAERERQVVVLDYDAINSLEEFHETMDETSSVFSDRFWGNVVDGRDQFGALLLRLSQKSNSNRERIYHFLERKIARMKGCNLEMNPGFVLLMISELEKKQALRHSEGAPVAL